MEIYKGQPEAVRLDFPLTATTADVTITQNGVTVYTFATVSLVSGGYEVTPPFRFVSKPGTFTIHWKMTYEDEGTQVYEADTRVDVVCPYVSITNIRARIGTDVSFSDDELRQAERQARAVIDSYVGQTFGSYDGTKTVIGAGNTKLTLPERLVSLTSITGDNLYPDVGYYSIFGDGWYIGETRPTPSGDIVFETVIRAPSETWNGATFRDDQSYVVTGTWGYSEVPSDVTEAALIIIEDALCPEAEYRDRYIKAATTSWTFTFSSDAFRGTGSVTADQILKKYRRFSATVI